MRAATGDPEGGLRELLTNYNPYMATQDPFIATHSLYTVHTRPMYNTPSAHTVHIDPRGPTYSPYSPTYSHTRPIYSPYKTHTAHIQYSRQHAVFIQCVYSPYRCIQTHIHCVQQLGAGGRGGLREPLTNYSLYIAIQGPYMYSHVQSIYSPYTAYAYYSIHPK